MKQQPTILITGAGSAFGQALARHAAPDYRVALADCNTGSIEQLSESLHQQGHESLTMHMDVTQLGQVQHGVEKVLRRWQQLDVLVNAAELAAVGPFEAISGDHWQNVFDTKVMGTVNCCQTALSAMKRRGQGQLVNVAAMAGLTPPPLQSCHSAANAAVIALSESLLTELAPIGIGVTLLCPPSYDTHQPLLTPDPLSRARFRRHQHKSLLSPDELAVLTLQAIKRRQFLVLADTRSHRRWREKRWFAHRFYRRMHQLAHKLRRHRH